MKKEQHIPDEVHQQATSALETTPRVEKLLQMNERAIDWDFIQHHVDSCATKSTFDFEKDDSTFLRQ